MADARFVYIADEPSDGADDKQNPVWWRLVAANYRVLGRLSGVGANESDARASAADLRSRIDDAMSTLATDVGGRWVWNLAVDGVVTAVCAHPFPRRVDCARALALFIDGIRAAEPYDGLVRYPTGGRYLRRRAALAHTVDAAVES